MAGLERARRYADKRKRRGRGGFTPYQLSKISGWLRLAASTTVSSEWQTVVDVLNGAAPMAQTDADRYPAVGAAANGLPTMVLDASDVMLWPLSPSRTSTTKLGIWIWYKPATVAGFQTLYFDTTRRLVIYANGSTVQARAYRDAFNGRTGTTPASTLTAGAWHSIYYPYDFAQTGDDKIKLWVNAAAQSLIYADDGAGGYGSGLQAAAGSACVGAETDSDTPTRPVANGGLIGPNIFAFNDNLTQAEIDALHGFERPT